MKRFVWVMMQVSILLTGLALATMARAETPAIDSPPEVIELKDIHVRFKVKVFGLARLMGRFERLRGELIGGKDGEGAAVRRSEFGLNTLQHVVSDEVEIIVAMNADAGE
jgi:polyisoprenoid-binding protein YceI